MWKEIPTEKHIVELTNKEGEPVGFRIFGEHKDAKAFCRDVITQEPNASKGMRGFLRKWEGTEQVWIDNDN